MPEMTNAQIALMAAAKHVESSWGSDSTVIRYADSFLKWLDSKDGD